MAIEQSSPYSDLISNASQSTTSFAKSDTSDNTLVPLLSRNGSASGSQPAICNHEVSSSSGAITLQFSSIGSQQVPVFMQQTYPVINGSVTVNLVDNSATEIRVVAKGSLATVAGQSATNYTAGETGGAPFWSESKILWTQGDPLSAAGVTNDMPFSLRIPEWVSMQASSGADLRCPTPPSYVFRSDMHRKRSEVMASVKYSLKVIIERKGLSKRDDRLSVPFTYMMERQNVNFLPSARKAALLLGHPLPGPTSDPSCWKSYNMQKTLTKSGIFTLKDIDLDLTVRLPAPALYAIGERLPLFVSMSASNLSKLGGSTLGAKVIERRWTGYGGLGPGDCYEEIVSNGHLEIDDAGDMSETSRAYKGAITIEGVSSTSFKTPKLEVQHNIAIFLITNGVTKDELASVPVTVFSV